MQQRSSDERARRTAEAAARSSYGRLLAILAARSRDISAAEDALSGAFQAALETWPERGIPERPEAWLLTAARRNALHVARRRRVEESAVQELLLRADERGERSPLELGDERLKLLFVCAHPALEAGVRTPLMLQTVLGLDAARIASAFLVAPAAMSQRLVRAKTKIKAAGVRIDVPEGPELVERLEHVLEAIYVAFGAGWDEAGGGRGLAEEAIFLGRVARTLMPAEPEVLGLLSLMLYCHARRDARRDSDGRFVPLTRQDPALWHRDEIIEAEGLLTVASSRRRFGRFQCEAAVQSVHAQRAITGVLQHHALRTLYDLLLARAPSIGVAVSRAAAMLDAGSTAEAARALSALDREDVGDYQPYWVTRGAVAEAAGDREDARRSFARAIELTSDEAVRRHLRERIARDP